MNSVEAKAISGERVLVTIKTGEIVQAQAVLSADHARGVFLELRRAIDATQNGQNGRQGYPDEDKGA